MEKHNGGRHVEKTQLIQLSCESPSRQSLLGAIYKHTEAKKQKSSLPAWIFL